MFCEVWQILQYTGKHVAYSVFVISGMFFTFLQMCPTYSAHLYVPAGADDNVVRGSAKFRSKGRLPVLSYYYAPKKVSFEDVYIRLM